MYTNFFLTIRYIVIDYLEKISLFLSPAGRLLVPYIGSPPFLTWSTMTPILFGNNQTRCCERFFSSFLIAIRFNFDWNFRLFHFLRQSRTENCALNEIKRRDDSNYMEHKRTCPIRQPVSAEEKWRECEDVCIKKIKKKKKRKEKRIKKSKSPPDKSKGNLRSRKRRDAFQVVYLLIIHVRFYCSYYDALKTRPLLFQAKRKIWRWRRRQTKH